MTRKMVVLHEVRQTLKANITWPHSYVHPEESWPCQGRHGRLIKMACKRREGMGRGGLQMQPWLDSEETPGVRLCWGVARVSNIFKYNYTSNVLTTKKWTMPGDEHAKQCDLLITQRACVKKKHTILPSVCMTSAHQPKTKGKPSWDKNYKVLESPSWEAQFKNSV